MCGRCVVDISEQQFAETFPGAVLSPALGDSSWNLAPTQHLPILVMSHKQPGQLRVELARWSLTPPWSPTLQTSFPTFNARAETAATKATWQDPLRSRRCVVIMNGFYEWSGSQGKRIPHYIQAPHQPMLVAGLYGWWRDPEAEGPEAWHLTAAVLTDEAEGPVSALHDRMPVFIEEAHIDAWIDPANPGAGPLLEMVREGGRRIARQLRIDEVAPLKGDGPHLTDPV